MLWLALQQRSQGWGYLSTYEKKPDRFLKAICSVEEPIPEGKVYCAGFELTNWRHQGLAAHLIEWLPEYALPEEELDLHHGNAYSKLKEAAVRVYTSEKYAKRGEAGEIALHAICRDFFGTFPISSRVFYKSASNDVVKSFDLIHARILSDGKPEIWLGESKLYENSADAMAAAIDSVRFHLDQGFLQNQKLLLGPQIPRSVPQYQELRDIFKGQTSLDALLKSAVFVIGIFSNSAALAAAKAHDDPYIDGALAELKLLLEKLNQAGLHQSVRLLVVYVPLATKELLVAEFDKRLKGLQ